MSEFVVAVVGAAGALGREVQEALREREFPVREWRLFDDGQPSDAADELPAEVMPVAQADFRGADLVFVCASAEAARSLIPRAHAAGATVIDLTQVLADDPAVPLVVPEVNADVIADAIDGQLFCSPLPGAVALSIVLKPLDEVAALKRIVVSSYESVSGVGDAGIEELSRQTAELLNGRSIETAVFAHRIAFNLIPQVGTLLADHVSTGERAVEQQVRRLLGLPELPITMTSVRVPTFFGDGYAVNVETNEPIDAGQARELLRQAPGVLLVDEPPANAIPTLVDAVGQEATLIGRIRDDLSVPYGLNLWAVIDGLRKGGAVNAVQIAELVVRQR